jgi:hypothetical protein
LQYLALLMALFFCIGTGFTKFCFHVLDASVKVWLFCVGGC